VSRSFQSDAGAAAMAAGVVGFLYSISFVLLTRVAGNGATAVYSLFLLVGGLLSSLALVALWERLREWSPAFALWALALGLFAALGSAIHGGYDLANALSLPARIALDVPNQVDPRGLLTFGFAGLAVGAFTVMMRRVAGWPPRLVYLGYLSAGLLVLIYLLRLIIPNSTAVLAPAGLEGFVVNPLWYIWLGRELRRARAA
jgi:hypothetical protein